MVVLGDVNPAEIIATGNGCIRAGCAGWFMPRSATRRRLSALWTQPDTATHRRPHRRGSDDARPATIPEQATVRRQIVGRTVAEDSGQWSVNSD